MAAMLLVATALLSSAAWAAEPSANERPPSFGRTSKYRFADALVEGLSWADVGADRQEKVANVSMPKTAEGMTTWISDTVATAKIAANDYRQAIAVMEPFEKDDEELVRVTAETFKMALNEVMEANDQLVALMAKAFDHGVSGADLQALADLRARKDVAWKVVPKLVAGVTLALVVRPEHKDDSITTMRLTKDERQRLIEKLQGRFGRGVTKVKRNETPVRTAAAVLYQFLSGKLKAMDE